MLFTSPDDMFILCIPWDLSNTQSDILKQDADDTVYDVHVFRYHPDFEKGVVERIIDRRTLKEVYAVSKVRNADRFNFHRKNRISFKTWVDVKFW